jgi:hypothetical protein
VPGAGDDAIIGDFTVILDNSVTVQNLSFSPTPPSGGSIGNALYVGNSATLTITGAFTWTAGTIGYPAGHSRSGGGTINIPSGAQWLISGSAEKYFFESTNTVINNGEAIWSGGNIHLYQSGDNGIVNNGTFLTTTDANLIEDTNIAYDRIGFVNNGTFRKSGGSGITNVTWAFTNHGVVDAQTGSITLSGGIENAGMIGYNNIHTGTFNAATGATVDFSGNTHVLGNTVRFTGAGRVRITGGAVQTAGNVQVGTPNAPGNFEITGGAFNPGNNTGGQGISPTGALVCSNTGKLYLSGGNIGGPINVQAGGNATWTGGELDGIWNIASGGTLTISGTGTRTLQGYGLGNYGNQSLPGVLNNAGTILWNSSGNIDIQYGDTGIGTRGAINNSGTFIIQNNQSFTGGGTFKNTGALIKQNSTGVSTFGEASGTMLINSGTLDVRSGTLSLNSINHTFNSGTVFSGAGRTRLSSGSITASGNFSFLNNGTFELTGGTLTSPGGSTLVAPATFKGNGTFGWTGGEIAGVVNIGADAKLNISGTGDKMLNGYGKFNYGSVNQIGTLNNSGTAIWTGSGKLNGQYGGAFKNLAGGTFNVQSNANLAADFSNSGTLNISGATGTSPGVFNFTGQNFAQTATGTTNIDMLGCTAGTQYDYLNITSGNATLGGTLNVRLLNGFSPLATDRFAVVRYTRHSGTFAAINGPFEPEYEDPNLDLGLDTDAPRISSISPLVGVSAVAGPPAIVGTTVTINGTNMEGALVFFNGIRAMVNTALSSNTRLVVTVPAGAKTGYITVRNAFGSAISTTTFRVQITISGSVTKGTAPLTGVIGLLPNVPVYLVNRNAVAVIGAVTVNPALLSSAAPYLKRVLTNTAGVYTFTDVAPGNYRVIPALPGVYFAQSFRDVNVSTHSVGAQSFVGAGTDAVAPPAPLVKSVTASAVSGTAADSTAGVLAVIVTLQNSAGAFFDWSSTSSAPVFSSPRLSNFLLAGATPTGAPVMNALRVTSQAWAIALPSGLPPGTYRLTVRTLDRAFRISVPTVQNITKAATTTTPVANVRTVLTPLSSASVDATSDTIILRFSDSLDAESATNVARYSVTVNGESVEIESAAYVVKSSSVVLGLPEDSLKAGDSLVVSWSQSGSAAGQVALTVTP